MDHPDVKVGVAFTYRGTGPAHRGGTAPHTCVVIAGPDQAGDLLILPICSYHDQCDKTAVIKPNVKWSPIKWDSYAAYYMVKKVYLKNLYVQMEDGAVSYIGEVPNVLMQTLLAGVHQSGEMEPQFLKYYKEMHS